jgi:hypothetical protein
MNAFQSVNQPTAAKRIALKPLKSPGTPPLKKETDFIIGRNRGMPFLELITAHSLSLTDHKRA